jgi:hypothetical protein
MKSSTSSSHRAPLQITRVIAFIVAASSCRLLPAAIRPPWIHPPHSVIPASPCREQIGAFAADVTGDSIADVVVPGKDTERVFVGVVEGPVRAGSRAWSLAFHVGKQTQDSLCGSLVNLNAEDPRLPLAELGCGAAAQGGRCADYKAADQWLRDHSSARGIRVDDGMCDSFHVYWDSNKSALGWWRL